MPANPTARESNSTEAEVVAELRALAEYNGAGAHEAIRDGLRKAAALIESQRATIEANSGLIAELRESLDAVLDDRLERIAVVTALEAEKAGLVRGLEGSTAIRSSTEQGYPVAVYFIDLAHAQKFHEFLTDRCAELRRQALAQPSTQENDNG